MPWTISCFLAAFLKIAQRIKRERASGHPYLTPRLKEKKLRRPTIVLDTTAYICVSNLNHVNNDTPKLKYFKVLSIKGHFMLSKGFLKSLKSRRLGDDDAIYDADIFSDSSVSQKTRLVVIADLRQNFLKAISDWFRCDFIVTVEESNWSPVFQKIGAFILY